MTEYLNFEADVNTLRFASALDQTSLWSMAFGRLILENLDLKSNITGLDLGCGTGFPLLELANMHDRSCNFIGLDVWDSGLARAQEKLSAYHLDNVSLIALKDKTFPLDDNSIDLITANLVLNNLDNPDDTLAECYRVAKPHARIAITTNLDGHMQEFYTAFETVLCDTGHDNLMDVLNGHRARRGTVTSHRALLERNGFKVQKQIDDTLTLRYLNGSAFLRHWFIKVAFLPSWKSLIPQDDQARFFQVLEAKLNTLSDKMGDLRLSVPILYLEGIRQ